MDRNLGNSPQINTLLFQTCYDKSFGDKVLGEKILQKKVHTVLLFVQEQLVNTNFWPLRIYLHKLYF